ncbi:MAG: alanyl-tRNA editing protein [Candidatus Nanoarchaeia archaeon]|nr:alanyl-tRNA editing protein [Candidatus Nanoarchaeia archaeon]
MDSYLKSIKTIIIESLNDYVILKDSIFHKEGGGQPSDKGWIEKEEILKYDGTKFYLKNNIFKKNQEVTLSIDWDYRYELMKAHTAEHLLFGSLQKINSSFEIEKIQLSENESKIFVIGEINQKDLILAQIAANEKIKEDLKIKEEVVKKEDVTNTRIKIDKIKDEKVRIINIGNYDKAACSGTHLASTKEIEFIIIKDIKKESSKITQLIFLTGKKAINYAITSCAILTGLSNDLNENPQKLSQRIISINNENLLLKSTIRKLNNALLNSIKFEPVNGIIFYEFNGIESEKLIKKASQEAQNSNVVFINDNTIIIAGKNSENIFEELKKVFEIKGGGREIKIGKINNFDINKIKIALLRLKY